MGVPRLVTVAQPAAGSDWSRTISTVSPVRLFVIRFVLTTSTTAATRTGYLQVKDPSGTVMWSVKSQAAESATKVYTYQADDSVTTPGASGTEVRLQLPQFWLPVGASVSSAFTTLQAGDQFSTITLLADIDTDG